MSANDVSNVHGSQQPLKASGEQSKKIQKQDDLKVFASHEVGAEVSLEASESNPLFNRSSYLSTDEMGLTVVSDKKNIALPSEFQHLSDAQDRMALMSLTPEQIEVAKQFASTKLSGVNIAEIVRTFNKEQCEKIKSRVDELTESMGGIDNVYKQSLSLDPYNPKNFVLRGLDYNFRMQSEILDDKFDVQTVESVSEHKTENSRYRIQEAYDLRTNTISKIRYNMDSKNKQFVADYEIRSRVNDNHEHVSREFSRPSTVKGVKTTDLLTVEGTQNVTSAKTKKDGTVVINKNMKSIDGTQTLYNYSEKPNGKRSMSYKIVTEDGKVLMDNNKTYTVISSTEFASTFNKQKYSMKIEGDKFNIVETTNPDNKATIDLSKIQGDREAILKSLTSMTGDELISLSKSVSSLVGIDNILESYYDTTTKSIHTGSDLFVALHELGHAKDFQDVDMSSEQRAYQTIDNLITYNADFAKIYNSEREAFNNAFPLAQREHVDYFINLLTHYSGVTGGRMETVAEGNAIHNSPMSHELLTLRSQYLQQYFPRTMAKLNEIFVANNGK